MRMQALFTGGPEIGDQRVCDQQTLGTSSDRVAVLRAAAGGRSLSFRKALTRAGGESYAVETMALCLALRLLFLPRKGE
jgi:hypothetical protein